MSVSGMQTSRLLKSGHWDAAKLVPVKHTAVAKGKEWTYTYVNGRDHIDIEIEPNKVNTAVGIEEIILEPILPQHRAVGALPNLFILGDSTVKSYTFDEAPMSGWGQIIGSMFNQHKLSVTNYSMGDARLKMPIQKVD